MSKSKFFIPVVFIIISLVLIFSLFSETEVKAENKTLKEISDGMKQRGVPVLQVIAVDPSPTDIEISLQSESTDEYLTFDDNWYMLLAEREATLAYRTSARISSFTLIVYNKKGEVIHATQSFLYPQDLNQNRKISQFKTDQQKTRELVLKELKFGALTLQKLDIFSENFQGGNGQILTIDVFDRDLDAVNQSLSAFLGSLSRFLETPHGENDTHIVLCHLRVMDENGRILLDYARDIETGSTRWIQVKGVDEGWSSAPVEMKANSQTTPQAYPAPLTPVDSTSSPVKTNVYPAPLP